MVTFLRPHKYLPCFSGPSWGSWWAFPLGIGHTVGPTSDSPCSLIIYIQAALLTFLSFAEMRTANFFIIRRKASLITFIIRRQTVLIIISLFADRPHQEQSHYRHIQYIQRTVNFPNIRIQVHALDVLVICTHRPHLLLSRHVRSGRFGIFHHNPHTSRTGDFLVIHVHVALVAFASAA
jgi:hypothetical protein